MAGAQLCEREPCARELLLLRSDVTTSSHPSAVQEMSGRMKSGYRSGGRKGPGHAHFAHSTVSAVQCLPPSGVRGRSLEEGGASCQQKKKKNPGEPQRKRSSWSGSSPWTQALGPFWSVGVSGSSSWTQALGHVFWSVSGSSSLTQALGDFFFCVLSDGASGWHESANLSRAFSQFFWDLDLRALGSPELSSLGCLLRCAITCPGSQPSQVSVPAWMWKDSTLSPIFTSSPCIRACGSHLVLGCGGNGDSDDVVLRRTLQALKAAPTCRMRLPLMTVPFWLPWSTSM
ncbi:hypothetical protein EYF80_056393 [Liparis tanakae]|uniref:Uncharacterized protein n=1 Tax=Liparis tanakae TaxID=230148 RepID=A0A4Z2EXA0_9TELE|nr:hypothetical protein EYF80_056393 [Liparis tanakae]